MQKSKKRKRRIGEKDLLVQEVKGDPRIFLKKLISIFMAEQKILVDSDVLIALYRPTDSNHTSAVSLVTRLHNLAYQFVVSNLIIQESTTVISYKMGMNDARKFYSGLSSFYDERISIDENIEKSAWDIFFKQTKKGSSFIDCSNIALISYYSLDGIVAFDSFYPKKIRISTL